MSINYSLVPLLKIRNQWIRQYGSRVKNSHHLKHRLKIFKIVSSKKNILEKLFYNRKLKWKYLNNHNNEINLHHQKAFYHHLILNKRKKKECLNNINEDGKIIMTYYQISIRNNWEYSLALKSCTLTLKCYLSNLWDIIGNNKRQFGDISKNTKSENKAIIHLKYHPLSVKKRIFHLMIQRDWYLISRNHLILMSKKSKNFIRNQSAFYQKISHRM